MSVQLIRNKFVYERFWFSFTSWILLLLLGTVIGSIYEDSPAGDRVLYQLSAGIPIMLEKFEFGYSMKNVSLPSQKEYVLSLISSVETFVKNLRWRSFFFLNPQEKPTKNNHGFKSLKAAPKIKELQKLEDSLHDLVKNVKFRKYSNQFQRKLKEDRLRIMNENRLIISADKSSNHFSVTKADYDDLLAKEVHKHYKKASNAEVESIRDEHTDVVTNLEIGSRRLRTRKTVHL